MPERSQSDEQSVKLDVQLTPEQSDLLEVLAVLRGWTVEQLLQDAIDRYVSDENGCRDRS